MAENIRGTVVVEPGRTAEYDRVRQNSPIAVIVVGVLLLAVATVVSINLAVAGGTGMLTAVLVGDAAFFVCLLIAGKLAVANRARRDEMTRSLLPLQEVAVFDEDTIGDQALWVAAGLAVDYMELEAQVAPLVDARVRTPAQERELNDRQQELHQLGERILALVTPAHGGW